MTRFGRIVLATMLMLGVLSVGQLVLPSRTYACSCAMPAPIGAFAAEPGYVVLAGVVISPEWTVPGHLQGTFAISRVFRGPVPAPQVPIIGGGGGDCTISFEANQQLVMVASFQDGFLTPGACLPHADMRTDEGRRLYAEAIAAFGPGAGTSEIDPTKGDALPVALIVVAVGAALSAAVFAVVVVAVRRRRPT